MKINNKWALGMGFVALLGAAAARTLTVQPTLAAKAGSVPATPSGAVAWGVNLAGAEFADYKQLPGTYNDDYGYPNDAAKAPSELAYYASKNLKLVRLPFRWERMQDGLFGPINEVELGRMRAFLKDAKKAGLRVIPDCHNYARYYEPGKDPKTRKEFIIGQNADKAALGDLWKKLIPRLAEEKDIIWAWDIMNEPRNMGPKGDSEDEGGKQLWADVAQSAISAIRSVDKTTPILIAGYQYSPTDRWTQYSDKLKNLSDPANRLIFEGHTYWDADRSGTYNEQNGGFDATRQTGGDRGRSVAAIADFVGWLRANKKKGFIGEYSVPAVAGEWQIQLSRFVLEVNRHDADVITGGTFWAGGPRWQNDDTSPVLDGLHADGETDAAKWRDKLNMTTYIGAIGGTAYPEAPQVVAKGADTDAIKSESGPAAIHPGQSVTVSVDYSATTTRKIEVGLKNPANGFAWLGGGSVSVAGGSGTVKVTFTVDAAAPATGGLVYTVRLTDTDGKLIQEVTQKDISTQ